VVGYQLPEEDDFSALRAAGVDAVMQNGRDTDGVRSI